MLHLGYAWLALGLDAAGLGSFGPLPRLAALHALTAGAFGTMTLAVMTRAALGHTGRALTADAWTTAIYAMVNLGALARLAAFWAPAAYLPSLQLAGLLWAALPDLRAALWADPARAQLGAGRTGRRARRPGHWVEVACLR